MLYTDERLAGTEALAVEPKFNIILGGLTTRPWQ